MNRRTQTLLSPCCWRTLSGLLLLAFLLRAFIPVGYMPLHAAGQAGGLSITLCITGLSQTVLKALALDQSHQQGTDSYLGECAFGTAASSPALPFAPTLFWLPIFSGIPAYIALAAADQAPMVVRGPPLGSRAPPR